MRWNPRFEKRVAAALAVIAWLVFALGAQAASEGDTGGQSVTMDLKGADVRDVLRVIAEIGGVNLVADPSVEGEVTLSLKGISAREGLDLVVRAMGLASRYVGNTIVVAAPERFAQGFDAIETRMFKLAYASCRDIKDALSLVIPAERLQIDARTNSVIASGVPLEIAEAERIVAGLDVPVPMVRIDARLEEIAKDALDEYGVNWEEAGGAAFGKVYIKTDPTTGAFQGLSFAVGAFLKMLEDSGKAATIARPSTTTLDGTEARIFIGDKIPVVISSTSAEGSVSQSVSFIEAGVKLVITPRVNRNGLITVRLRPEVSTILGQEETLGYPHVRTREADLMATVRDGETLAIGGLIQREEIESMLKLPILGDIPLLGVLFRNKKVEAKETEMVIFVTPRIVTVNDAAQASRGATSQAPTATAADLHVELPKTSVPAP